MKRFFIALFFLAPLPFIVNCRPSNLAPVSKICAYDGAHSGTTVKVRCTGIGHSSESAFVDAKKAAAWYVASRILQTPQERSKFQFISNKFYARYNTFLNKADYTGPIMQDDEGKIMQKAVLHVNRSAIVAFFKDFGISNSQATMKNVGNPTIAVKAIWSTVNPQWNEYVRNSASEFLTARKYNTIDLTHGVKGVSKLQGQVLKMKGVKTDKEFMKAMVLGADIYIRVAASKTKDGADVVGKAAVKAYETTTGRLLGSATHTGTRLPSSDSNAYETVKEAIQNATNNVLTHVMAYWKQDASVGNRYSIILAGKLDAVEDMADLLSLNIKKMKGVSNFKAITKTMSRMNFTLQSNMDQTEFSLMLKRTLRKSDGVKKIHVPLATRKMFVIIINPEGPLSDKLPPGI